MQYVVIKNKLTLMISPLFMFDTFTSRSSVTSEDLRSDMSSPCVQVRLVTEQLRDDVSVLK